MAKRCLEHFSLENTQYDFMAFSDLSFLVDNPYYGTNVGSQDSRVSSYGTNICQVHSSDSAYMHNMDGTSAIFQKELSTSYSGYTNFNLWINNTDTIVISNGMLTSEVSSRDVRWAIILDDSEKLGWVVSRHVDGNCYVCGGDNDTGGLIYYAFMYGVISNSGGAGSGYIGNSLLSNKKMVGYNVPTSSAESTKTESVDEASENPVSGKPKIGNGFAKIKLLREVVQKTIEQIAKNTDFNNHCKNSSISLANLAMPNALNDLSQYYGTDWNLRAHGNTSSWMTYSNNVFKNANDVLQPRTCLVIPLKNVCHVKKVTMEAKIGTKTTGYDGIEFWLGYSDGSTITFYDHSSYFMVAKKPVSNGADTNHKLFEIPGDSTDFNAVTWEYDDLIKNVNYVYIYLADTYIVEMKDLTLFLSEA